MKGYEWMDWVQLGGILAVISAIVTTWLLMARDNKSLERDHGDLSKDLSPLLFEHINFVGQYSFQYDKELENGKLRALNRDDS